MNPPGAPADDARAPADDARAPADDARAPVSPLAVGPVRRVAAAVLVVTVVVVLRWGAAPATLVLGSFLVVAAVVRLLVPAARIPSLVVRSRFTDATVLAVLGVGIVVFGQLAPGA